MPGVERGHARGPPPYCCLRLPGRGQKTAMPSRAHSARASNSLSSTTSTSGRGIRRGLGGSGNGMGWLTSGSSGSNRSRSLRRRGNKRIAVVWGGAPARGQGVSERYLLAARCHGSSPLTRVSSVTGGISTIFLAFSSFLIFSGCSRLRPALLLLARARPGAAVSSANGSRRGPRASWCLQDPRIDFHHREVTMSSDPVCVDHLAQSVRCRTQTLTARMDSVFVGCVQDAWPACR